MTERRQGQLRKLTVPIAVGMALGLSSAAFADTGTTKIRINLREAPDLNTAVVKTLPQGSELQILGYEGEFAMLQTADGDVGYLKTKYLEVVETAPEPAVAPDPVEVAQVEAPPAPATPAAPAAPAAAPANPDDAVELSKVEVTGTRIRSANALSSVPLQVVDSTVIDLSGEVNVGDIVRSLPVAGVSTFLPNNSNFATSQAGVTTVDLRNLGEDRTLVLVNGRRFVAGLPGQQVVDFNSIPAEFIDRVEVITGGASAVYGSDALAGAINIILKDDFEGVTLTAQTGETFDFNDDQTDRIALTMGSSFAEGRGNAIVNASWSSNGGVFARDRPITDFDCFSDAFFTGDAADFRGCTPFYSSFPPNTRIIAPTANDANDQGVFPVNGTTQSVVIDPQTGQVRPFVNGTTRDDSGDGFNRQGIRALSVPLDRALISTSVNFGLSQEANVFFEGTYARTRSASELEPFPLQSDDVFDSLPQCFDDDQDGELDRCDLNTGVPLSSGVVPQALRDQVLADNPSLDADSAVLGFARRLAEVGNRGASAQRQTFRVVTGVEGDLLDIVGDDLFSSLNYELSFNYGTTSDQQLSTGQLNVPNLRESFNIEADPTTGDPRCANPIARAEGCAPSFIFGLNTITPDALAYIQAPVLRSATIEQTNILGFISGSLGQIPTGGPIGFSLGVEHRRESSEDFPDALTQTGQNGGNQIAPQIGSFEVDEVFGEIELPLLIGQPFADYLAVKGAVRFSDYTTIGSATAYAFGLDYAPNNWARFRTQFSRAVRAPNIGELFSTGGETFATVVDPCAGVTIDPNSGNPAFYNTRTNPNDPSQVTASGIDQASVNSALAQNCLADPLVAQRVSDTGGFIQTQPEAQGTGGFINGSPPLGTLTEETADSITIGAVFTPQSGNKWLDALTLTIDYFDIEIEDAIDTVSRQLSLDNCYSDEALTFSANNPFCANIRRFDSGPQIGAADEIDGGFLNFASINTAGVDVQLSYDIGAPGILGQDRGRVLFSTTYTNLIEQEETAFGVTTDFRGVVGFAKHRGLSNLVYNSGPLTLNWTMQYIGESFASVFAEADRGGRLGSTMFHDFQLRYSMGSKATTTLVLGVDNVFDEFVDVGAGLVEVPVGHRTIPEVYEPFGRAWYAGLRMEL